MREEKGMKFIKRSFDIVCSLLLIICLSPLFAAVTLLLLIKQHRPIFFVQKRVGKNENAESVSDLECFEIYKFRTFIINSIECASKDARADEVTPIGKILRKTSIDELPQLFNILKGDMSFVGPRPLIPAEENIKRLRFEAGVYKVKPGMTGWAQVNGRDELTDEEKVRYDKEYIENMSLAFDIKILFKSVTAVLSQRGVN